MATNKERIAKLKAKKAEQTELIIRLDDEIGILSDRLTSVTIEHEAELRQVRQELRRTEIDREDTRKHLSARIKSLDCEVEAERAGKQQAQQQRAVARRERNDVQRRLDNANSMLEKIHDLTATRKPGVSVRSTAGPSRFSQRQMVAGVDGKGGTLSCEHPGGCGEHEVTLALGGVSSNLLRALQSIVGQRMGKLSGDALVTLHEKFPCYTVEDLIKYHLKQVRIPDIHDHGVPFEIEIVRSVPPEEMKGF